MKRRFTDAEKWRDSWFLGLKPADKLAYLYILDSCDPAGVWEPEFRLLRFVTGLDFDEAELLVTMGCDRVEVLTTGHWWMKKFIAFQYGRLVPGAPNQRLIFKLIEKYNLSSRVDQGLVKGCPTLDQPPNTNTNTKTNERSLRKTPARAVPFVAPTLAEVAAYGKERGSPVDPKRFWENYAHANPPWTDRDGKPVRAWKQKFVSWDAKEMDRIKVASSPVKTPEALAHETRKQKQFAAQLERAKERKALAVEFPLLSEEEISEMQFKAETAREQLAATRNGASHG